MGKLTATRLIAVLTAGLAAGCSAAGSMTTGSTAPRIFDLASRTSASEAVVATTPRLRSLQVVVDEPTAVRSLDGEMILVAMSSSEITSLAGASWSDRLPRLVQARMVAALSAADTYKSVGSGNSKASADIIISSDVRAFQIEAVPGDDVAHVAINVRLIREKSGEVIGTRLFDVSRKVREKSTEASVTALNAVFDDALHQIVDWSAVTLDPKGRNAKSKALETTPGSPAKRSRRPDIVSQYDPRAQ